MMLVEVGEPGFEQVDLDDVSDDELRSMYAEARDDYCDAVTAAMDDYADYQQACAHAVVTMANEARRRGIVPGWVH